MGSLGEIFSIGDDGAKLTVYGAIDAKTAMYLALAIFLGMVLALGVYAKALK